MQLDSEMRENLEDLQRMLRSLRVTALSKNFSRIVYLIDVTLLRAAEISEEICPGSKSLPLRLTVTPGRSRTAEPPGSVFCGSNSPGKSGGAPTGAPRHITVH
jgi:hypothetical protein